MKKMMNELIELNYRSGRFVLNLKLEKFDRDSEVIKKVTVVKNTKP